MSDSTKKKPRTESQHYVPQFYLRGFKNSSAKMYCYDKAGDKTYPTTTAAAAQEPYFYEIPSGSFEDSTITVAVNAVEKALNVAETAWAPLHAALIKSADEGRISARLTIEYAPFLVMQWMRTRTHRDAMREAAKRYFQSLADDLTRLNFPGEDPPEVTIGDKGIVAGHAQRIFDQQLVERMSHDLERHYWVVGINNSKHSFTPQTIPSYVEATECKGGIVLLGSATPASSSRSRSTAGTSCSSSTDCISRIGGNSTIEASN